MVFKILHLTFDNLIIVCFSVDLVRFNLFGILWASSICMSISLPLLWKFLVMIALNIYSVHFFLFSFWDSHNVYLVSFYVVSPGGFLLLSHFFPLPLFFFLLLWITSNGLSSRSLILYSVGLSLILKLLNSWVQSLHSAALGFMFVFFLMVCLCWASCSCIVSLISFSCLCFHRPFPSLRGLFWIICVTVQRASFFRVS